MTGAGSRLRLLYRDLALLFLVVGVAAGVFLAIGLWRRTAIVTIGIAGIVTGELAGAVALAALFAYLGFRLELQSRAHAPDEAGRDPAGDLRWALGGAVLAIAIAIPVASVIIPNKGQNVGHLVNTYAKTFDDSENRGLTQLGSISSDLGKQVLRIATDTNGALASTACVAKAKPTDSAYLSEVLECVPTAAQLAQQNQAIADEMAAEGAIAADERAYQGTLGSLAGVAVILRSDLETVQFPEQVHLVSSQLISNLGLFHTSIEDESVSIGAGSNHASADAVELLDDESLLRTEISQLKDQLGPGKAS